MTDLALQRLVGVWEVEAAKAGHFMGRARAKADHIEDDAFIRLHFSSLPSDDADAGWIANAPTTATWLIGADDSTDELAALYADARGVKRVYRMSVEVDTWTIHRAAPGFHQRFVGTFQDDARRIDGRWESSPDGSAWEPDFEMTYRKLD